jgi:Ca2+/Na+ antiporter
MKQPLYSHGTGGYVTISVMLAFFHLLLLIPGIVQLVKGRKEQKGGRLTTEALRGIVHLAAMVGNWILFVGIYIVFIREWDNNWFVAMVGMSLYQHIPLLLIAYGSLFIAMKRRFKKVTIDITTENERYLIYEDMRRVLYDRINDHEDRAGRCARTGEVCWVRDDLAELEETSPTVLGFVLSVVGAVLLIGMFIFVPRT